MKEAFNVVIIYRYTVFFFVRSMASFTRSFASTELHSELSEFQGGWISMNDTEIWYIQLKE
jgi:hypothetical protein